MGQGDLPMKIACDQPMVRSHHRGVDAVGRRKLLLGGGAAVLATTARRAEAQSITVPMGIWGGVMIDTVKAVAAPRYAAQYPDVQLTFSVRGATDEYSRLLVTRDHPDEAGGMWTDLFSALAGKAGMFNKFDDRFVPERANLIAKLQPADGVGITFAVQPYGIAYNPKYVEKPTSWLDLFNPKYEGKVGLIDNFYDHFVMLSRVLGKDEHDIEIAFDEWAKHKKSIGVFTNTFPQLEDLLDKGEMWLGPHWGGFATGSMRRGLNIAFAWPKEGCTQASVIANVTKNTAPNISEFGQRFINIWLTPEYQTSLMERAGLSPTNAAVKIPPELAGLDGIITDERLKTNRLVQYDYAYVGANLTRIKRLFDEKLR
jgi:putative spermidine/putrescine transport system substrate-binding protein